jgi:hypothetical protein
MKRMKVPACLDYVKSLLLHIQGEGTTAMFDVFANFLHTSRCITIK